MKNIEVNKDRYARSTLMDSLREVYLGKSETSSSPTNYCLRFITPTNTVEIVYRILFI